MKTMVWSSPYRCVAKTAKMLVNMKTRMTEFRTGRMEDVRADRRWLSEWFHLISLMTRKTRISLIRFRAGHLGSPTPTQQTITTRMSNQFHRDEKKGQNSTLENRLINSSREKIPANEISAP